MFGNPNSCVSPDSRVLVLIASRAGACALAAATAAASAATTAETRIRLRIYDESIEEQIDRVRHDFYGIERGVIERVSGALNGRDRSRYAGGVELRKEIDTRRRRHRH